MNPRPRPPTVRETQVLLDLRRRICKLDAGALVEDVSSKDDRDAEVLAVRVSRGAPAIEYRISMWALAETEAAHLDPLDHVARLIVMELMRVLRGPG